MNNIFQKSDKPVRGGSILKELLKIRERKCECCGLTMWLDKPINLQAHHKDGDKTNNELDNLLLLCLNCHSYTDNFCSKNIKKKSVSDETLMLALQEQPSIRQALLSVGLSDGSVNYKRAKKLLLQEGVVLQEKKYIFDSLENICLDCGETISNGAIRCKRCSSIDKVKNFSKRPDRDTLKVQIRNMPFTEIGKKYKVSDNAVRKWCQFYGLPSKKSLIKQYTEEEWAIL